MNLGLLLLACASIACGQQDLTLQLEEAGTNVVLASIARIQQSGIFTDDNRLLRRIAYAETRDGVDVTTYRVGYNGGIWQVDEDIFNKTQDTTNHPELLQTYQQLQMLGVDWPTAAWADLRRPFFSALAARLYFTTVSEPIPLAADLRSQGEYWKRHYNRDEEDTVQDFIDSVTELEVEGSTGCPSRGLDLVFVLDSSGSVGQDNFELTKEFAVNITKQFTIGPQNTHVGAIVFSDFAQISFQLNTSTSGTQIVDALQRIPYIDVPGPSTNTADALRRLRLDVLTSEAGARPHILAIPRVAIVVTDGRSSVNTSRTIPEAEAVHAEGIIVFSVGVGRRVDMVELNAIATSPSFVSHLTDFNILEFQSYQLTLSDEACTVPAPVNIEQTIMSTLDGGELSFFQFELPVEGMTLQLQVQQGRTVLYASSRIRNPSAALYDVRLETDTTADVYLDPSDFETTNRQGLQLLQKRQIADMFTNITLYVTIEGVQDTNFFTLETTFGDTSSATSVHSSLMVAILLTLTILAQI